MYTEDRAPRPLGSLIGEGSAASRPRLTPSARPWLLGGEPEPDARGLGVCAPLPRWLAVHRMDGRSRAQACAPPCRHRQPLHSQPAARRAPARNLDARSHRGSPRGGTHQAPAAGSKARVAEVTALTRICGPNNSSATPPHAPTNPTRPRYPHHAEGAAQLVPRGIPLTVELGRPVRASGPPGLGRRGLRRSLLVADGLSPPEKASA
jgi:hypothetical protein